MVGQAARAVAGLPERGGRRTLAGPRETTRTKRKPHHRLSWQLADGGLEARVTKPNTSAQRGQDPVRFTQVPDAVHGLVESPREYQLVALLISYRWYPSSPIIPSVRTLAGTLKCSERTVRRTVAGLEARGLVQRVERRSYDDRQMSNEYVLCNELLALVTAVEAQRDQDGRATWQGRRSRPSSERYSRKNTNRTRASQGQLPGLDNPERYRRDPYAKHVQWGSAGAD